MTSHPPSVSSFTATPGVCIAATASGSGKTTIATGLIAALARRMKVAPFKVGPDYIDPGYHSIASGCVGRNLDSVLCGNDLIGPLYCHGSQHADIAVVEGVMGLFDGRISDGAGSTADIAATLGVPILLIVDVRGMSQSVGAVVRGFATTRSDVRIAGVILNKVGSDRHAAVCREAVEAEGIPVVGSIPRQHDIEVPSRHLGNMVKQRSKPFKVWKNSSNKLVILIVLVHSLTAPTPVRCGIQPLW